MSKSGPYITAGAAWLGVHAVTWLGLRAFVSPDQVAQIQNGLSSGVEMIALSLMASAYAWVVKKQTDAVKIVKAQVELNPTRTPGIDHSTGAIGSATLNGLAQITGVSIERAATAARVSP